MQGWDVPTRAKALTDHFTFFLFTNICRSLFEKDKVLFAFKLAVNLRMASGLVDSAELRFLLTGGVAVGDNRNANPAPQWLSEKAWTEICLLDDLPAFKVLALSVYDCAMAGFLPRAWQALPSIRSQVNTGDN